MTTATTIIEDALGALGIVAPGEHAEADHLNLGLRLLNREIDTLAADSSVDYRTQLLTFSTSSASVTIGPTGTVVCADRVDMLKPGCYATLSGSDYPLQVATTRQQYTDIVRKTRAGPVPQVVWLDTTYPNATVYLWPIPQGTASVTLAVGRKNSQFEDLTTSHTLQSGLEQAFVDLLTIRLGAHFRIDPPAQAVEGKRRAMALIRRLRMEVPQLKVPSAPSSNGGLNVLNGMSLTEAFNGYTNSEAFS